MAEETNRAMPLIVSYNGTLAPKKCGNRVVTHSLDHLSIFDRFFLLDSQSSLLPSIQPGVIAF